MSILQIVTSTFLCFFYFFLFSIILFFSLEIQEIFLNYFLDGYVRDGCKKGHQDVIECPIWKLVHSGLMQSLAIP